MDGSDLKVSDSSGSDRNPLRLPSERLLRRIETSGDLFAAAPEAFGLSEVVLGAHVALAQKLRRADAAQLKIASKVVVAPGHMFGFLTGSKPNPDRRESAFAGALRRGSRRVSSKTDGSHRSSTTSTGSDRRGSGDRRHRADSRASDRRGSG